MKNIVALVDFSELAFKLLRHAHDLAKAFGSHVVLLHVVPKQPTVVDVGLISATVLEDPSPAILESDAAKMQEMQESLAKFGVNVTTRQIQATTVAPLLEEIAQLNADLIIIGSHRHSAWYEIFFGSISHEVLQNAPCPVLVVPEQKS